MKNIGIKVLLLIGAIGLAVGGVMYYIKTIVEPPIDSEKEDVYNPDLESFVNGYNPSSSNIGLSDDKFDDALDRVDLYYSDDLITSDIRDEYVQRLLSNYTPCFRDWAYTRFEQHIWKSHDHELMRRIIEKLRNIKINNGRNPALDSELESELSKIETILDNYNSAWAASRNTTYTNLTNARSSINIANDFKSKEYIGNCEALVAALNEVPVKIMRSHCLYIRNQARILTHPTNYTRDQFDGKRGEISKEIEDLKNFSYGNYGIEQTEISDSLNSLRGLVDKYTIDAQNIFNNQSAQGGRRH